MLKITFKKLSTTNRIPTKNETQIENDTIIHNELRGVAPHPEVKQLSK